MRLKWKAEEVGRWGVGGWFLIQVGRVVINSKLLLVKLGNLSQSLSTMKAMAEIKSELYTKGESGAAVRS